MRFPEFSRKIESKKPGDKLIIYIGSGKLLIPGILEADRREFVERNLFREHYFPSRVQTKHCIVLDEKKYVSMRKIKDDLSFIRPEVKKFCVYFMQELRKCQKKIITIF